MHHRQAAISVVRSRLSPLLPRLVDALLGPEPVRSPLILRFWHRQVGPRARLLEGLAAEFSRLHPDLTVLVESRAEAEHLDPCLRDFVDPGPGPDLMEVDAAQLDAAVAADLLERLDDDLDGPTGIGEGGWSDLLPPALRAARRAVDGREQLMAMPLSLPAAGDGVGAGEGGAVGGLSVALLRRRPEQRWGAWVFLRWLSAPEQAARWCLASGEAPARRSSQEVMAWPDRAPARRRRRPERPGVEAGLRPV